MPAYEYTSLTFEGYGGEQVPNRFMRQSGAASTLAVVYPGLNYTCDMPLLYYPSSLLLYRGADVLQVKTDYTSMAYQSLPGDVRLKWMDSDSAAALRAGRAQRAYAQTVLIGKSIGTLALARLIEAGTAEDAAVIWLTPLLHQPLLVEAALKCKGPALFVVGTGDRTYDPASLGRIRESTGAQAVFVEGGNHSLEIEGDLYRSLEGMVSVLQGIEDFLDRQSIAK